MTTLHTQPRWTQAAQALVDGCIDLRDDEDRVALLGAVCEGLGDALYPAFLRVLTLIGQHGDHAACAAVARVLVHALRTGRLPSGRRGAWGSGNGVAPGNSRSLGPLEYLCAWHAQADAMQALAAEAFQPAARALMDLVSASPEARQLYCEKLLADADDPLSGALTRQVREALRALALAWSAGASSHEASARFLNSLSTPARRGLGPLFSDPAFSRR